MDNPELPDNEDEEKTDEEAEVELVSAGRFLVISSLQGDAPCNCSTLWRLFKDFRPFMEEDFYFILGDGNEN